MDKRFQVFVSSTYEDLREERAAVISALLQLDCFPAGMELFPAADDDSLTLIKSVIDDSDYYLIIVGGRYGTLEGSSAKSYTHLEYEYALSSGKPTIALLHSNPGSLPADKTEGTDEGRKRFNDFREELRRKNCRHWSDRSELTAAVFTGVQHLKRTRPAVGWTKATGSTDDKLKDELLQARREMAELARELEEVRRQNPPPGAEGLARGAELTTLAIEFPEGKVCTFYVRWEQIIRSVLPQTLGAGADERTVASTLTSLARENFTVGLSSPTPADWEHPILSRSSFGKVINQMLALGLIVGTQRPESPETIWRATPYGAQEGCRQVAERADPESDSD
ncbi:MAG: DUF4062 domain-containing protein [Bryobacteraceae bacterium]